MNRRRFLEQSVLSLTGLAAAEKVGRAGAATGRVIVIGAGISGLVAARTLHDRGYDVVVVEGRDRIGGRIWTDTTWNDVPIDLGASWIHGVRGNPLSTLSSQARVRQVATSYSRSRTYNTSGAVLTRMEESALNNYGNLLNRTIGRTRARGTDTSIRQVAEDILSQLNNVPDARTYLNFFINTEIEHDYSGSASNLSNNWYDDDSEYSGGDALLSLGFGSLTEFLARGLKIELGQKVWAVDWNNLPVRVKTDKTEFTADRVLVTLPLGVLQSRSVQFAPALPATQQNAISKLGMGLLNKCVLRFSSAFWPAELDWIDYVPEKHGQWAEWFSYRRSMNQQILVGFNAADYGRQIEALSDGEIIESAMVTLRTIYGARIPEPADYLITRWASDPFSQGSYSFNALGSVPIMRKELARSQAGRLFFAGEATNQNYFGTAHGAYLSGQRAATEIVASFAS